MADPSTYRPRTGDIPTSPGVYRFRDEHERVIYVGKAKNLRQRLTNYFQDLTVLHPRTRRMVTSAARVEWTVVTTEVEALTLEYSWIKEYDPRFNVKFRDDKSYPYLAVTMGEKFPRVHVTRRPRSRTDRSFGPYTQVWAIRETVDLMLRVFPVRTCSAGVFRRAERSGRACLLGSAPLRAPARSALRITASWQSSSATSWPATREPICAASTMRCVRPHPVWTTRQLRSCVMTCAPSNP